MTLFLKDFVRSGQHGSFGHVFTHKLPDGGEICLESCLSGYCVARYDAHLELISEKKCTKINGMLDQQIVSGFSLLSGKALAKALKLANTL